MLREKGEELVKKVVETSKRVGTNVLHDPWFGAEPLIKSAKALYREKGINDNELEDILNLIKKEETQAIGGFVLVILLKYILPSITSSAVLLTADMGPVVALPVFYGTGAVGTVVAVRMAGKVFTEEGVFFSQSRLTLKKLWHPNEER
ncbi:hypothetical protein A2872_03070 [Candidatus Gottesmanbacteria bacterium RIFCSPHIGHO2_01_FULL_42_12]|uniref:Uncharacterized protein n=1 Tax=Candidatus Gottesmanbacteria bacterium RIFCSPHIGHO2_01_FULL_42_12 TaxID=1798377 RepID=A0A1F5Z0H2_9BACT|nr:MAG: hypothetical protein A2872_03070 [Candidatus Gottesmanbacteria bacterium RIFCSPHIGHO2_01_FULL_42_12]